MAAVLKGITWGHSRGITPLLAASQRYGELHPGISIHWEKRSLQEFADAPIEKLAPHYDLLIIDHPWAGTADATRCVLPLNDYLPASYLDDQAAHTVGESHVSYIYNDKQWALAIDAATPAASYRADLFEVNNHPLPTTWEEVLALASAGKVAVPAIPIDLLMNFYTFCIAHGEEPFSSKKEMISTGTGIAALASMKELYGVIDKRFFSCNPIAVAELMTSSEQYWYCPFAYCYSNYSRTGFAGSVLRYTGPVSFNGVPLRTTIGGTGIAVSATSSNKEAAIDFAKWVVSPLIQRTLYAQHGGQPGHRAAWQDQALNELTNNFFRNILPTMDAGYVRPRYHGYLYFQDHAGKPLQQYLMGQLDVETALAEMNLLYVDSIRQYKPVAV